MAVMAAESFGFGKHAGGRVNKETFFKERGVVGGKPAETGADIN